MPNKLTDNFLLQTGQPLDARYLTGALAAYADVAAANTAVPVAQRHVGLKVLIGTAEYWWSGGVANENLVAVSTGGAGAGDVVGPASSTDNAIALFDGINGELLQDSPLTFASGTLTSSDAGLTLQANAGTSGRILLTATAAGFLSPDNTDEIGVANGTITIATNILGSGGSLTLTDAGMQLGGSGARITTIHNTAAGDSSSETVGVTAGWAKTFGPVRTVTTATVDGVNGYTYIIDEGRSADTTINIDSIELFTCIIVNKSAHNVVIYNDADQNTSSTMCPAGCTALFQLSYDTGSVFSSYILPAQDLGEGIVGYVAKTSRTDGQPDHYVSYVGTSGGVTLDLTNNCNASGRVIQLTGANANFTPSTGMPTGAAWVIEQASTGVATVVPGSCTLTGESAGYKTAGQYARIYVEHVGSDVYRVIGGVP